MAEGGGDGVVGGVGSVTLCLFGSGVEELADEPSEEVPGLMG